jgi:molybdopterin adenylyltransferase
MAIGMSGESARGAIRVLTITMSDTRKRSNDESGRALVEELGEDGIKHVRHVILKEEPRFLQELVRSVSTDNAADAIVITGGTGITPRDQTYEALHAIFDKHIVGFGETFRRLSWDQIGPHSILSRATAGVVNECLVFALPGSIRAVRLGVKSLILPILRHAVDLAAGRSTHVPTQRPPPPSDDMDAPPSGEHES